MFGWFKTTEVSKDRFDKIAKTFLGLETGLKGIENHWAVGNKQKGDELFDALFNACFHNFLGGPADRPQDLRMAQREGILQLMSFLLKHGKHEQLNKIVKALPEHIPEFQDKQLANLMHLLDVSKETLESKQVRQPSQLAPNVHQAQSPQAKVESNQVRLSYYVCQSCGMLNLVSTQPCVHCGFAATTEKTYRRALLLNSQILETPFLLKVAGGLILGADDNPKRGIEHVWPIKNVDETALARTKVYDQSELGFDQLLKMAQQGAQNFHGIPKLTIKCPQCQAVQDINTHEAVHTCISCKAPVPTPYLRRLKAALRNAQIWLVTVADHADGLAYANFIASYVLIMDYALRRDALPSRVQAQDLIARFNSILPLSYFGGNLQIRLEKGRLASAELKPSNDPAAAKPLLDGFRNHLMTLHQIISMLSSEELTA